MQSVKEWSCRGVNLLDPAGRSLGQSLAVRSDPSSGMLPPEAVSDPPPHFDPSPWPAGL